MECHAHKKLLNTRNLAKYENRTSVHNGPSRSGNEAGQRFRYAGQLVLQQRTVI
jgi:hypothetical protein